MGLQKKSSKVIITIFLSLYVLITIMPFYFLFVRAFVPTKDATTLYMWLPKPEEVKQEARFGGIATYYNLKIDKFQADFGIKGYVNPQLSLGALAKKYNIPWDKIESYFAPFLRYNGFITAWQNGILKAFFSTLLVAVGSIAFGALLTIMTASVIARFKKRWHTFIYNLFLMSMIIPTAVTMLPNYLVMTKYLGLYDNYLALIILNIQGGAIPIMIFTSYISTIPDSLWESVRVDGGSRLAYFTRILLPNCKTPFASYVAILLPMIWNNLLASVLYLKPEHFTITALINNLQGTYTTNFQAVFSGLLISMIPILLVYLVFQNLFVKSAMLGAVKG
jgi:ABC-type glycerol-3-phosphate transport system permease component